MKNKDYYLGGFYVVVLVGCYSAAFKYLKEDIGISIAWVLASVFISRAALDLGTFSSPEIKARFSAAWSVIAAILVLLGAYLK